MVTNDTGPRHIAAALNIPIVTLFGPTDHRWTTIPYTREQIVLADPTLPEEEVANDHPERCAIEQIGVEGVMAAAQSAMGV
jgi:ADP-heptose:LPS heptosyltransferase